MDRAPARCSGGHGIDSRRDSPFFVPRSKMYSFKIEGKVRMRQLRARGEIKWYVHYFEMHSAAFLGIILHLSHFNLNEISLS